MIVNKAYRYRIYPTREQKITFAKTFGYQYASGV
ncbi:MULTISPECIES: helix-turn-helix domain-containing protein [unclassified Megasphaera]